MTLSHQLLRHLLGVALLSVSLGASAQLDGGYAHVGVGLGNQLALAGADGGIPPVALSYDHPVTDAITVGGYLGFTRYSVPVLSEQFNYNYIIVGARGTYHLDVAVDKLDPYGGVLLGYNIVSANYTGNTPGITASAASGVGYSFFVGANYDLTDKLGAFAELGYGIAWLQLGLNVRL